MLHGKVNTGKEVNSAATQDASVRADVRGAGEAKAAKAS